jgi:hypothetical protein
MLLCDTTQADERSVVRALGPDAALASPASGAGTALAAAEAYVAQGRPADAARLLRQRLAGTAASAAVDGWCRDAEARAAAEQTIKLLRAHATVLAASVI